MEAVIEKIEFLPTRQSLIEKLTDIENQETWREFFDLYWRLIYGVAIKSGFSHEEAEDLVQDTVIAVAKNIGRFRRDPAYGSFKSWLLTITYRKMKDLRRRARVRDAGASEIIESFDAPCTDLEQLWDAEWNSAVTNAALEKMKRQIPPKHFQAFFLNVIKEMSPAETAQIVGLSIGQVYLLKHRLVASFKKCVEQARTQLES
jgi:RNA polymerase sigma factor (sigma-70 family)